MTEPSPPKHVHKCVICHEKLSGLPNAFVVAHFVCTGDCSEELCVIHKANPLADVSIPKLLRASEDASSAREFSNGTTTNDNVSDGKAFKLYGHTPLQSRSSYRFESSQKNYESAFYFRPPSRREEIKKTQSKKPKAPAPKLTHASLREIFN